MGDKIAEILVNIAMIAYGVASPATFIYLIATMDNWTLLNAVPYVLFTVLAAGTWWIYWPMHWLLGLG